VAKQRYSNMDNVIANRSFQDLRKWRKERIRKKKDYTYNVPQHANKEVIFLNENRARTSLTWIGHSTFLIQKNGLNIVTDPVWAMSMAFNKRLAAPGLQLMELPQIDVVLISHGHYDHLDLPTLRKIPGKPKYMVPIGLAGLMRRKGFDDVVELSWWENTTYRGVRFDFLPAQHWTRRTLTDMNSSLWGGWLMRAADSEKLANDGGDLPDTEDSDAIYFAGDSGYFRGFRDIGERFGPFRYVLMPIGAYEPEWFMSPSHMTPEDAVKAWFDVGGEQFIPMHYGAFKLADDTPQEALDRLIAEWTRLGIDKSKLHILHHGETIKK
jgi:L-ascorbate metabolism protein UlaG (beta-lactamase superfamily)